jgi:predicted amidohydrolase YtcJ
MNSKVPTMTLTAANRTSSFVAALISASVCVPAIAADVADVVYRNGRIYTVNDAQPWAEAVAIKDGKFVYVGSNQGVRAFIGPSTQVENLRGRMAMPGLHDAHDHLLLTGMNGTAECQLPNGGDVSTLIAALRECAKGKPKGEWLIGNVYQPQQFPDGKADRKYLDEAFPDTPVFLREWSWHHALANSKALELAGVTDAALDPAGGRIVRDENGRMTGELLEKAGWLVAHAIPAPSAETLERALLWSAQMSISNGITSVQEASANRRLLETIRDLDRQGKWPLRVAAHIVWDNPALGDATPSDLDRLIRDRAAYSTHLLRTDYVKIIVDGSPLLPHQTDVPLDEHGNVPVEKLLEMPLQLAKAMTEFDRQGIKVKMHVTGTGSSRAALDAIEAAHRANGGLKVPHEVAHSVRFGPGDLERVAALGAMAEFSPAIWYIKGPLTATLADAFPFKAMIDSGATITIGSDWVILPSPNLFPAIGGMLDRGKDSIELRDAIRAATLNGAIAVGWERTNGSIEVGKFADMIVLDRNLFEIPQQKIGDTRVLKTILEGRVVYQAKGT